MKYILEYTKTLEATNGKDEGLFIKRFNTKKELKAFFKTEMRNIYWSRLREKDPSSKLPKMIIPPNDPGLSEYTALKGVLETYFETGLECLGLAFYRDDAVKGPRNPDFDPAKPASRSNFEFFRTYEGMLLVGRGHLLELEGVGIIGLERDRDFAKADGHQLSYYPRGFSKEEWLNLFLKETKVCLWVKNDKL